jgi:hypothetical protein
MADVTINSVKYNVNGSLRDQYYNVTGATGSTLTVGMFNVRQINSEGGAITAYTTAAGTVPGTTTITLTGTMSATDIQVIGN